MLEDLAFVTARKIPDRRPGAQPGPSTVVRGRIVRTPVPGRPMVILRDPYGLRIVTTPVQRVLSDPDGQTVYVHTATSLYVVRVRPSREAP